MKTLEVTVQKEHANSPLGLALAQKSGSSQIIIRTVSPSGVFANTKLVPGLQLVEINASSQFETVSEATTLLKSAPPGNLTLLVKGCMATAHKQDINTKVGLSLKKVTSDNKGGSELVIENISSQGIFANSTTTSSLQQGYRISTINGTPCPQLLSEATSMIRKVQGDLTIVAVESELLVKKVKAPHGNPSLGAYLDKHHVSMGADSTYDTVKTLTGDESQNKEEKEAEITIEPNSKEAAERELNSMPIVHGAVVVEEDQEDGRIFDSEYGGSPEKEQEITIERNSEIACERMRNTPFVVGGIREEEEEEQEGVIIDSEYGDEIEEAPPKTTKHMNDVTTVISKGFPGEKVGLALKNVKETKSVVVNRLVEDGLAIRSRSPLSLGQTILYINGQKCPPSAKRATTLVTEAPRTITIIARNTLVKTHKQTVDTKLGITLRSSKRNPNVKIEHVDPDGLFGTSMLAKGQTVVAINGKDCPGNAYSAIARLKSLVGEISIVVGYKPPSEKAVSPRHRSMEEECIPPIVTAIHEPSPMMTVPSSSAIEDERPVGKRSVVSNKQLGKWVGISFTKAHAEDQKVKVVQIQDYSPFANSELQVGHFIVKVNNLACPDSITELISLLYRTSGELVITSAPTIEEANKILLSPPLRRMDYNASRSVSASSMMTEDTSISVLPPGQVVALINKTTKEERIGIRVVRSLQERIVISSITKGGLLSKTKLAPGQFIVSVNGIPCPPTKEETVQIIRNAVGPVEIIASSSIGQAVKATASTKVGITIGRTISNEMIIVGLKNGSLLESDSPWALRDDQLLISINGLPCPKTVQEAVAIIKQCVGVLTIVAVDRFKTATTTTTPKSSEQQQRSSEVVVTPSVKEPPQQNGRNSMPARLEQAIPPPAAKASWSHLYTKKSPPQNNNGSSSQQGEFKEITAVVQNKEASDMLGLSMGVTQDYAFVNHISADSPFVDTDLCVGHRIATIDGEDCPLPLSDAMELFAQHVGTMTIEAKEKIVSPGQVSASIVVKQQQTTTSSPGIAFATSDQGRIVISKIDPNGMFADSALQLGQVLELINGRTCLDAETSHDMLATASGKVTIVASMTVAKAVKQDIDQSAGITLGQGSNGRGIIVKGIEESEVFGTSGLKIGQRVVSIAGVSCPDNVAEAEGLIQDCVGELSIVAVDTLDKYYAASSHHVENGNGFSHEATNEVVTVSVYKENRQSKVGMKMRKGIQDNKVIISGVNEDGPAGGKGLEVGMYIISIDGIPCPPNPKMATGIIKEATGHFEVVASPTVASISKKTKDEKLGVTLSRTVDGEIVVHGITNNSSFKGTDLQVGQKVVSINGTKCSGMLDGAIKALADSVGHVTIVALDTLKT